VTTKPVSFEVINVLDARSRDRKTTCDNNAGVFIIVGAEPWITSSKEGKINGARAIGIKISNTHINILILLFLQDI
jgi:hypothetical protein